MKSKAEKKLSEKREKLFKKIKNLVALVLFGLAGGIYFFGSRPETKELKINAGEAVEENVQNAGKAYEENIQNAGKEAVVRSLNNYVSENIRDKADTQQGTTVDYVSETDNMSGNPGKQSENNGNSGNDDRKKDKKASGRININTATKAELCTLTGIGPAKADKIISFREERGGFEKIEELMQVPGIKEGTFNKIRDKIEL
ncbi:MAG: helix-hairpin-helix domain-containing protein [Lachnospiraceae bacterium]|nr:helix-hairpin-helix domain-containing protein [Lachnospiraceae bacterium]